MNKESGNKRHKWTYTHPFTHKVQGTCEKCGLVWKYQPRKSERAFGGVAQDVVIKTTNGKWLVVKKLGPCTETVSGGRIHG